MPSTSKTRQPAAKTAAKRAAPAKIKTMAKATKTQGESMSLTDVMRALEKAGSEKTRKTYMRHGATGSMFGVAFGTLGALQKRIRVDHELALKLWDTGNVDGRNLAMKIADPTVMKPSDLDRWARENGMPMCNLYIGSLASESPHGNAKAREWLASSDVKLRAAGWTLVGILANRDEATPDEAFAKRLDQIEKSIHSAPNEEKAAMNGALIAISGRSPALRKAACAAAKRIGKVEVDHGDTACETPDAIPYIEKMWARSRGRFPTPAAAERARESMRTRC
jgi:3-methyladenine DNA glycosylase AlkD